MRVDVRDRPAWGVELLRAFVCKEKEHGSHRHGRKKIQTRTCAEQIEERCTQEIKHTSLYSIPKDITLHLKAHTEYTPTDEYMLTEYIPNMRERKHAAHLSTVEYSANMRS